MIKLENVSLGYDDQPVLSGINLDARPSTMTGLIGPNGSGKSTLIKGINGVLNMFSGHVTIDGRDLKTLDRGELARLIATVPQNPVLPPAFTAFEVVLMGRTPHLGLLRYERRKDMLIAWQAMKATKTDSLAERRVGELSGGEGQRLVIARALTQEAKAILLDEPTANLDINHQVEILNLVKGLCRKQGLTVIAALHDLNLAAQYCDWLVMLNGKHVYARGTPQEVLTPQNIREVYGAEVYVIPHPANQLPTTLVITGNGHDDFTSSVFAKGDTGKAA